SKFYRKIHSVNSVVNIHHSECCISEYLCNETILSYEYLEDIIGHKIGKCPHSKVPDYCWDYCIFLKPGVIIGGKSKNQGRSPQDSDVRSKIISRNRNCPGY